jgi:hypothetical protein
MKKRCWKGYAPVKGKKPYSKGSCRKVRGNPARQADEAIARELLLFIENDEILSTRRYPQYILNLERKMKRGVYDRERAVKLFMYLADEASKRYSKQFGDGKTHTADVPTRMLLAKMLRDRFESERRAMGIPETEMADLEEPRGIIRGKNVIRRNPSASAARLRRDEMSATILITAIESGYGWFYTKDYKIAEIDDTPSKVSADLFLDEEVTKDDYPDEFSKAYQPKRTFKAGEKIHVDNSTIQKGLQLVSSGKIKVADSYRKLASKLYFWPYSRTTDDMPDFDAYDADIFLQAGVFGNVIFG